ncbi:MAG: ATP-binding protein [Nitrospiraceae bacterium]|nr:ATP-binding protein [Nitrospiraceae bacterium]
MQKTDSVSLRLKALIAFRVLFATILLGSFLLFEIGNGVFPYGPAVLYLVAFLYFLTIVYIILLNRVRGTLLAYAQLVIDVLTVNMLIYLTGGIESWFSFLLIITVIASGIVIGKRAGFVMAVISSILYGVMLDLQYWAVIPVPYSLNLYERDFLYNIFTNIMALYICAYLTGYLVTRVEKASLKLEKKNLDYRELSVFNREVVENVTSGLITTDMEGRVLFFNAAAESITGMKRQDAIGRDAREIFPCLEKFEPNSRMEGMIRCGELKKIIGMTISGMKNTEGEPTGHIAIFQDLTQIKDMQEEIRRKEKWAAIGELSANIAHEIRNPLASLRGSIEMLKGTALNEAQKSSLMDIALAEMDRLNLIITDFLTYSRPTKPQMEPLELDILLGSTAELLGKSAPAGVSIRTELGESMRVLADPGRLQQVFLNLGINAFDAMPGGGVLTISGHGGGGWAHVVFSDTGKGISAQEREKIFFPFYTTKDTGTGLGLSIALRIMEDHGGTIRLESREGEGSAFTVSLPFNNGR